MLRELSPFYYITAFTAATGLAFFLTIIVKKIALKYDITDNPARDPGRKIHKQAIPLIGGWAPYLTTIIILMVLYWFTPIFNEAKVTGLNLLGISLGGLLLMIGGHLDDRYDLIWYKQLMFPVMATIVVIISDIGMQFITNPLGGTLALDTIKYSLGTWAGITFKFVVWADIFTFIWMMGMTYTTKFLDGLDGLVAGVSIIAALTLFVLSQYIHEPQVAIIAVIFAGAMLGFLYHNFNPATIFLGEGGAVWSGFMLAILGILSVGKVATALLVMGIPILDTAWVILRRTFIEKTSPLRSDRKHLHHRLLDIGLTQKQSVLFLYLLSLTFGVAALFLQSFGKLIALGVLLGAMFLLAGFLVWANHKKYENN